MSTTKNDLTTALAAAQPPVPAAPETAIPLDYQTVDSRAVPITRSKKGLPCLWENGGGWSNTGTAQIITDGQGYPKRALHVQTWGNLACRDHALIPVRVGDHVVTVRRHRDRVALQVERIASIQEDTAVLVPETEPICVDAINAAIEKANDYHCRSAYYINYGGQDND